MSESNGNHRCHLLLFLCSLAATAAAHAAGLASEPLQVQAMQRLDPNTGWVAGRTQLLRSDDGGAHWRGITPPASTGSTIGSAFFLNAQTGWVVQEGAATESAFSVSATSDGGTSWVSRALNVSTEAGARPLAIDFVDAMHGWLMLQLPSSSNFSRGLLLATEDGGASWKRLPDPPVADAIRFVSAERGWLAGGAAGDRLYVTVDGGQHWTPQRLPDAKAHAGAGVQYSLPTFRDGRDGALGVFVSDRDAVHAYVYRSEDGGASWRRASERTLERTVGSDGGVVSDLIDAQTLIVAPQSRDALTIVSGPGSTSDARFFERLAAGEAVDALDFRDAQDGWLLVASGTCDDGKSNCRQNRRLLATGDGGATLADITPRVAVSIDPTPQIVVNSTGKGFDKCAAGTTSQMQAWWTNTPWSYANIYIGGGNRGCAQANLNAAWINAIIAQGWMLIPTWVGPQAPGSSCTSCGLMSSNTTTARAQGVAEANAASDAASALGLNPPTIVYYDMERYDPSSNAAARAFLDGWTAQMHARGNRSGVYGAPSNASADWAAIANPPDAVWIAAWNGNTSVFGISGLSDSLWTNHQRLHQYQGGHNETWGGVTFNIDSNSADGPVADR